ncbi:MAG: hypothetical protein ACK4NR_04170 [Micavibrio sp.]
MTTPLSPEQALENVYQSLNNNNEDIDEHIRVLKEVLPVEAKATILVNSERLPQNNRQGRKMMQSYFKKRGLTVQFGDN